MYVMEAAAEGIQCGGPHAPSWGLLLALDGTFLCLLRVFDDFSMCGDVPCAVPLGILGSQSVHAVTVLTQPVQCLLYALGTCFSAVSVGITWL
jgi:hypothetical protein